MLRALTGATRSNLDSGMQRDEPLPWTTDMGSHDVLYRCGIRGQHCSHGFRSSFSTIMNARHPQDAAAIEAALAHVVGGVRGIYMRGDYLERRRELMADWTGLLLDGAPPSEILLVGRRR